MFQIEDVEVMLTLMVAIRRLHVVTIYLGQVMLIVLDAHKSLAFEAIRSKCRIKRWNNNLGVELPPIDN